jgi:hypothetical protein
LQNHQGGKRLFKQCLKHKILYHIGYYSLLIIQIGVIEIELVRHLIVLERFEQWGVDSNGIPYGDVIPINYKLPGHFKYVVASLIVTIIIHVFIVIKTSREVVCNDR